MPLELTQTVNVLNICEPLAWLAVLLAVRAGSRRVSAVSSKSRSNDAQTDETPPEYGSLQLFAISKVVISLVYSVLIGHVLPISISSRTSRLGFESTFWTLYLFSTVCAFFIMAAVLRRSFQPLPGLATAALIVFRYAAVLAFGIALTAHLPTFSPHHLVAWADEVSFSFMACVCAFEVTVLVMLTAQLNRLGMFLRSRPIGIAFGLAVLGGMDLVQALTINLSPDVVQKVGLTYEAGVYLAALTWTFYILRPEPRRVPHSLSPASRLMKWNEIAMKLELAGKQAEHVPFISGVESIVDSILKRSESRAE